MAGQPTGSESKKQGAQNCAASGDEQGEKIRPDRQRCCGFAVGEKLQQIMVGCPGEEYGQRASAKRKQERLDEKLLHDPRARSPQCTTNRKLMLSRQGSRQAKSGKIDAADEQHHTDENLQQKQWPCILRTQKAP